MCVDCRAEPDLELEGLLKRQHTRIKYFQGSLMNAVDLERAKVSTKGVQSVFNFFPIFCSKSTTKLPKMIILVFFVLFW